MTWLVVILGLALLVLLHELGHFTAARLVADARPSSHEVYERMSTLGITLIMFVTVIAFANDLGAAPH
jgi:hypothetical protein